ncbi:hypothetical protein ACFV0D_32295 [Streptomyces sp. NPDC059556]|uniref:hypothetical protein n=1 Tax=Streptomyces sp. NPDC059556 TaxID=3346863 RepID=UPI003684B315
MRTHLSRRGLRLASALVAAGLSLSLAPLARAVDDSGSAMRLSSTEAEALAAHAALDPYEGAAADDTVAPESDRSPEAAADGGAGAEQGTGPAGASTAAVDPTTKVTMTAKSTLEAKTRAPGSGRRMLRAHPVTADTGPEPAAGHFLALAVVRCVQGRYAAGAEAARHALTAARKVPGTRGQGLTARAFALQAASLGLAGRLDQARAAGDQALAPAEAYGDPTLLGSVLSTLRENARRAGRLHEAVRIGNRALALAEQSGDPVAAAFELANLAELRLLLEEPEPALALAERAVSGAEAHDAWCLPHALATMARVRVLRGETEQAAAFVDRAEEVATALGDRQAEHEARTARVELALSARRPHDALRALDGHADDAPVLAAWAELLSGRPGTAQRLARAEVARAERTGERLAEVEARIALGTSLTLLARAPEGASELARAESSADSLPYPAGTRRASWARGLLDGPTRR